ncbi:MAG: S8 family serine peptidase, partial [Candidatus Aenigmarchaeota archaeon]|nr:S8 family serine peptidase [Candidatus Aenigmarchaeota archaeon]
MRILLIFLFSVLALAASIHAASVDAKVLSDLQDSNEVPVIVMLQEGAKIEDIRVEKEHEFDALNGFSGKISRRELGELLSEPGVSSVELDAPIRLTLSDSAPLTNASLVWPIKLDGINITGSGETVCVIDTGADYNHTGLGSGWGNKVVGGYDFVNSDTDPYDDHGHGTYTAGIVASSNATYRGLAPDAKIVAIKALDSNGDGFESDAIAGINWCVANSTTFNISVISMSLSGSTLFSNYCDSAKTSYRNAVNAAVAKNISVIASSGNNGNTSAIPAPACIQNATSVGSTTKTDGVSSFSNRNSITDLLAPGSSITSLVPTGSCLLCSASGVSTQSGTSASAPHVSAAFALLRQFKKLENGTLLNPSQIESALKAAGKNISDSGLVFQRINVLRSLFLLDAIKPSLTVNSPLNQTYNTTN